MCVQPNTQATENKQQNPLQIQGSCSSEVFTEQTQNSSLELPQIFSEIFSWEQNQDENERLKLHHQKESKLQINFYENKN